jgi:hypothetical protein
MRNLFSCYIRPTEEEFKKLWEQAIFVPDTNVLLDLYRYSEETANKLLDTFELLRDKNQLWIPYQVGLEFSKDRPKVIISQENAFSSINSTIDKIKNKSISELRNVMSFSKHPELDKQEIEKKFLDMFEQFKKNIDSLSSSHRDYLSDDPILIRVLKIFDNQVGPAYTPEKIEEIKKEGEDRYKKFIPPGFSDLKKAKSSNDDNGSQEAIEGEEKVKEKTDSNKGGNPYGDLIIWFQMIDYAISQKKPIIFISGEVKEDWIWTINGKKIMPRPELIQEMKDKAGVQFYSYQTDNFLFYSNSYLGSQIKTETIKEVKEIISSRNLDTKSELMVLKYFREIQKMISYNPDLVFSIPKEDLLSHSYHLSKNQMNKFISYLQKILLGRYEYANELLIKGNQEKALIYFKNIVQTTMYFLQLTEDNKVLWFDFNRLNKMAKIKIEEINSSNNQALLIDNIDISNLYGKNKNEIMGETD